MKKLLFILSLLIIACSDKKLPHPFDDNLKGNVKSIEQITYEAKEAFGEIVKGERRYGYDDVYTQYNENGREIHKAHPNPEGQYEFISNYNYDVNGRLESRFFTRKLDSANVFNAVNYYQFNDLEKLLIVTTYESDSVYKWQIKHYYDDLFNLISIDEYDANDVLKSKSKLEINENEDSILQYKYDHNGELVMKYLARLDENKNMIFYEEYDKEGDVQNTIKFNYTFDEFDNWIQRLEFWDNESKPRYITERTITYN